MKITLPYRYTAEVIPPRCRKPRRVEQSSTITLTLHEVSMTDAPVAILEHGHFWNDQDEYQPVTTEFRYWRGKLWTRTSIQRVSGGPRETQSAAQFLADPYPYNYEADRGYQRDLWYESQAERRKEFIAWAANQLFIDGERWSQAGEPRYVIMTYGLGHNHGIGWGTSLSDSDFYNSNISRDCYFRIDQYAAALAEATRIAAARGDTKALPIEETQRPTRFEILIPEAVKMNPRREHGRG